MKVWGARGAVVWSHLQQAGDEHGPSQDAADKRVATAKGQGGCQVVSPDSAVLSSFYETRPK